VEKKNNGGRPEAVIEWDQLDKLCQMHATQEEIAAFLGITVDTIDSRLKKRFNKSFSEYYQEKAALGKISLRRAQLQKALGGDNTMMIWLGKNMLGQKDSQELDLKYSAEIIHRVESASVNELLENVQEAIKLLESKKDE